MFDSRKLRVFLCHASQDKSVVRELYQHLDAEEWIDPWLDEEKLLPGQDWDLEIEKAVEASDAVIVCLSNRSVTKEGYIQKELRKVLDIALEKPEGTIFIIPLRLDECEMPRRLRTWHYVDYFPAERREWAFHRLLESLKVRSGDSLPRETNRDVRPLIVEKPSSNEERKMSSIVTDREDRNLEVGWSIPLLLFFAMKALDVFAPSDDTVEVLLGFSAILAGIVILIRKQIPETVLFKVSLVVLLLIYGLGYRLENLIGWSPYVAGLAALVAGGMWVAAIGKPKKHVFYSSISFAIFLFLVGMYEIILNFELYQIGVTFETLILITCIVTSVLLWRDL